VVTANTQTRAIVISIWNYIEVLKPRETILLAFIGFCAAVIAGGGQPPIDTLLLATLAILMGSGAANGLTNYLDREVDARMERVKHRPLPSKRIFPASAMGDRPGDRRVNNCMVPSLSVLHLRCSRNYSSGDMEKENNMRLAPGGNSELCPCGYRLRGD
jgi:hypothetical protein